MKINKFSKKRVYKKRNYNKSQKKQTVVHKKVLSRKKIKKLPFIMKGGVLQLAQNSSPNFIYLQDTEKKDYHGFTPLQLNCALLQYLVNQGHIQRYTSNDPDIDKPDEKGFNQGFIGFKGFPSLIENVSQTKKKTKRHDVNAQFNFYDVYEGGDIKRPTISEHYANLQKGVFEIHAKKVDFRPKFDLPPPTKPTVKYEAELNDDENGNDNEGAVKIREGHEQVVPPERIPTISEITKFVKVESDVVLTQDIGYVRKNIQDLEKLLSNTSSSQSSEICDLYGDDNLIIHQEKFDDIGDVVIVGYPSEVNPFFKLHVNNPENPEKTISLLELLKRTIFQEHSKDEDVEGNYCQLVVELYNALNPTDTIPSGDHSQYYKLNKLLLDLDSIKNLLTNYRDEYPIKGIHETQIGDWSLEEFERLLDERFKPLIKGQYTRPNTKIRYAFQMFIKKLNGEIQPMIYNVRDLERKHTSVLEKVLELIKTVIPNRFGLLKAGETSLNSFYTYYRYGDFMYFMTEYIPASGNFTNYSHEMRRCITLEELIYSSKLITDDGNPFWSKNVYEYSIKDYRIKMHTIGDLPNETPSSNNKNDESHWVTVVRKKRTQKQEKKTSPHTKKETVMYTPIPESQEPSVLPYRCKVIIFRTFPSSIYEIYYKTSDGQFYFMVLTPILDTIDISDSFSGEKLKVYDCFGHSVNVLEMDNKPIFKAKWIPISSSFHIKDINLFRKYYNFPLISLMETDPYDPKFNNGTIETRGFVDLRKYEYDKTKFSLEKYLAFLKHFFDFYPFSSFNILTAENQLGKDDVIPVQLLPTINQGGDCFSQVCPGQSYNHKFKFAWNGKAYLLVVNKHRLQLLETIANEKISAKDKEDLLNRTKYVAWLFLYNDEISIHNPDRIKNIKDIDSYELLDAIQKVLTDNRLYNENEHILVYNIYSSYDMKSFHLHVFNKKDISYYRTSLGQRSLLGTELRLERLANVKNKMKTYPRYYKDTPGSLYYGSYQIDLF
jgi:hypothetical protein